MTRFDDPHGVARWACRTRTVWPARRCPLGLPDPHRPRLGLDGRGVGLGMKTILALVMFSAAAWAVELPGGSSAQLQGTEGTGFLLLVSGSGRCGMKPLMQRLCPCW